MKRPKNIRAKRKAPSAAAALYDATMKHISSRPGCMVASARAGLYVIAFVTRKFTAVEIANPEGFQPYTSQKPVEVPVPLILLFDAKALDRKWLDRFHRLGGVVVLARDLPQVVRALEGE